MPCRLVVNTQEFADRLCDMEQNLQSDGVLLESWDYYGQQMSDILSNSGHVMQTIDKTSKVMRLCGHNLYRHLCQTVRTTRNICQDDENY